MVCEPALVLAVEYSVVGAYGHRGLAGAAADGPELCRGGEGIFRGAGQGGRRPGRVRTLIGRPVDDRSRGGAVLGPHHHTHTCTGNIV